MPKRFGRRWHGANPESLAYTHYFAELIDAWAADADADERLFRLGCSVLDALAVGTPPDALARYFECWLLRLQGVYPTDLSLSSEARRVRRRHALRPLPPTPAAGRVDRRAARARAQAPGAHHVASREGAEVRPRDERDPPTPTAVTLQDLILKLSAFWASRGCLIQQPLDLEVGAGTSHPETLLRVLGPRPWSVAYVQPSRRPDDGRFGQNPNRLFKHLQMQVILKPAPDEVQQLYLDSLEACGINPRQHDIRFEEDNWESPTLGAWGIGWQVMLDGQEITQFTYFQQVGGVDLAPVSAEITYGLERIAMFLQKSRQRVRPRVGARRAVSRGAAARGDRAVEVRLQSGHRHRPGRLRGVSPRPVRQVLRVRRAAAEGRAAAAGARVRI